MSTPFEARLHHVIQSILDVRIGLLAVLMAEGGTPAEEARPRLGRLVTALRAPRIESTLEEDGRRVAFAVEDGQLVVNRDLLERVGDPEILAALARPIARLSGLASVSVSLAFQIDDDQVLRDLVTKAQRDDSDELVRVSTIFEWVEYRVETLSERLVRLCGELGRASLFETSGARQLQERVQTYQLWPEWSDVSDLGWCVYAVAALEEALEDTPYEEHAEILAELMWDSVVLSPQSFLRRAGRALSSESGVNVTRVLGAMANAIQADVPLSTDITDWSAYQDVADAWRELNRHERANFGPVEADDETPAASVLDAAGAAFGINTPRELPWDRPLLCWTSREQRALRDLLTGFTKTLPGQTTRTTSAHTAIRPQRQQTLTSDGERKMLSVQVAPIDSHSTLVAAESAHRTWSACVVRVLEQFASSDEGSQVVVVKALRAAYDELFPATTAVWSRRLFQLGEDPLDVQAERLVTAINGVFREPIFFDPFLDPGSDELAPIATLTVPVGITASNSRVAFSVPMAALRSTLNGAPLRLRAVEVPASSEQPCRWVCDRGLHLSKLAQQSVELITASVRDDALQMALFEP